MSPENEDQKLFCPNHGKNEATICRNVKDVRDLQDRHEEDRKYFEQRMQGLERADSQKHGEIYELLREQEKGKMSTKTFWSALSAITVVGAALLGIVFTVQNIQINNTREDQLNSQRQVMDSLREVDNKVDLVQTKVGEMSSNVGHIRSDLTKLENRVNNHYPFPRNNPYNMPDHYNHRGEGDG